MTESIAIEIGKNALLTAIKIASPILGVGLFVGFSVGVFQAVTQINEMTLTFIPKIMAVALVILYLMPWMIQELTGFMIQMITLAGTL